MSNRAQRTVNIRTSAAHVAVLWALGILASAIPAAAGAPGTMELAEIGSGSLLFRTHRQGRYVPAPVVATEIDIRVSGLVARVSLRQQFYNPTEAWLEAVYAFPLPENSAVDHMRLKVGDQVIEATIKERQAARKIYHKARREGRRAALVEQHRPNIFTNAVANIGPKELVTVELGYQHTLRYDQGRFRLRFPMVVAPRYIPGPLITASAGRTGWASAAKTAAGAKAITSPVLHPDAGAWNPVALNIELDAGFPLAELHSPYHRLKVSNRRDGRASITLAEGAVPADRDFELVWMPQTGKAPVAGVFRETVGGDTYLLIMVLPPHADGAEDPPPRDAVFVIDRSGSMAGTSIEQARLALKLALDRLRPDDRFNIIRFATKHDSLFRGVRPANRLNVGRAKAFVSATKADGGTEMAPALRLALSGGRDTGRLRQVVFLTDGAVGNELQLLRDIETRLNGSRLFTIGIGSAPNSYFMRKAAQAGRGSFTYIGKLSEVAARMDGLFRKLERPAMTDLLTVWSLAPNENSGVDAYPKLLPDLYHGEPLVVAVKLPGAAAPDSKDSLQITGVVGGRQWRHKLALAGARAAQGISSFWARARIADLMDSLREGANPGKVRESVTATALRHNLVSRYTSLVAVATQQARSADSPLARARLPLNLPKGWDYDKVFGKDLLRRAPARMEKAALGATGGPAGGNPVFLPQGATGAPFNVLLGMLAVLAAGGILLWRRRWA